MKSITRIAAFAAVLSITATAFAADTTVKTPAKAKTAALICPVTGEKIASVKDAVGKSTYKGKTYYFCCPGCKPMFDANPAKYTKALTKTPAKKAA